MHAKICFVAGLRVVWCHPSLAYTGHYQPKIEISVISPPKQRWYDQKMFPLHLITEHSKVIIIIVENYYDQA